MAGITIASQVPPGEDWIPRRFRELETQARENLASVAASFETTVAELQAQNAELAAQIARIDELVHAQVSIDSWAQSSSSMAFTTTVTAYSSFTFPAAPPGFAKATVFVTGAGRCLNTTGAAAYFLAQTQVDASGGAWVRGGTQQAALQPAYQGTVSASCAGTLNVTGGQSLTVSVSAWTSTATTAHSGNYVGFDAVVIYTR